MPTRKTKGNLVLNIRGTRAKKPVTDMAIYLGYFIAESTTNWRNRAQETS